MLSAEEKNDLYLVYASALGEDPQIKAIKSQFNEETVQVVEQAVSEVAKCNANMTKLLADLIRGSTLFAKGWLKKGLKKISKALKDGDIKLNGYGCMVATKAKWREAVIISTL